MAPRQVDKTHACSAAVGLRENQETRFIFLMFSEVESHQPFPEHQQVSSEEVPSLSERTFPVSPRLNASASLFAVSSSLAPMQGMDHRMECVYIHVQQTLSMVLALDGAP